MLPRYLLDTDVLSSLVRDPHGHAAHRLARAGEDAVCTSIVVAGELRFGAEKSGSRRLVTRVEALLSALPVLPLDEPADRHYGEIRGLLAREGIPIGPNDLWIASHARSRDLCVVTGNLREFTRVPALKVESWLATGV